MGGEFMFRFQLHFDAVMTTAETTFSYSDAADGCSQENGKYLYFGVDSMHIGDLYAS